MRSALWRASIEVVRPSVLIVDDHRRFPPPRALLESEGFDVLGEAADGDGALREAATLRPELVLLDIQLPDHDGFAIAEQLASDPSPPAVILISTATPSPTGTLSGSLPSSGSSPRASCQARQSSACWREWPVMRQARLLLWPIGLGVGLFAEWVAFEVRDPGTWIPDLVTGWTLMATGLIAWQGRPESRVGILLTASGFTWFVGNFADVGAEWVAWIAAHAVYVHRGPLFHAVLTFPVGRAATRLERAAVVVGYIAAFVTPVWRNKSITIALATLLVIIAVRRFTIAVARERHARRTAMYVAIALGLVLAGGAVARLAFIGDVAEDASLLGYEAVLCGVAIVMTVALLFATVGPGGGHGPRGRAGRGEVGHAPRLARRGARRPDAGSRVLESRCRGVCRRDRPAALAPDLPRRASVDGGRGSRRAGRRARLRSIAAR